MTPSQPSLAPALGRWSSEAQPSAGQEQLLFESRDPALTATFPQSLLSPALGCRQAAVEAMLRFSGTFKLMYLSVSICWRKSALSAMLVPVPTHGDGADNWWRSLHHYHLPAIMTA